MAQGRTSARGSHSILQEFQRVDWAIRGALQPRRRAREAEQLRGRHWDLREALVLDPCNFDGQWRRLQSGSGFTNLGILLT